MKLAAKTALVVGCLAAATAMAGQTAAPKLHADPFKTPQLAKAVGGPVRDSGQARREDWRPQLRGIMRSTSLSLVNVNGQLIEIGEEIDGFRLVGVGERSAAFTKRGFRYLLSLDHDDDEQTDDKDSVR